MTQQIQLYPQKKGQMINNAPISQIHLIEQLHSKHKRRLQKITQSRPKAHQFTLSSNFLQMMQNRKFNHENWISFNRNKEKLDLLQKNQKMFNRLIQITVDSGPYSQNRTATLLVNKKIEDVPSAAQQNIQNIQIQNSQVSDQSKKYRSTSLHHNYHLQNLRRSKIIDQQNSKIAQRIMDQTGSIDHSKHEQKFRKTREVMRRLRKFDQVRRAINHTKILQKRGNSQIKFRSNTLPSAGPKTLNAKISKNSPEKSQYQEQRQQTQIYQKINHKQDRGMKQSKVKKQQQKRYKTIESIRQKTQTGSQQLNRLKNTQRDKERHEDKQFKTKKKIFQSFNN